ncbi:hypothetical protein MSS93_00245 [Deinococcus radiodurans]|nr:hypothetical protein MSS93_00245 [Deinococcus radiodurans]
MQGQADRRAPLVFLHDSLGCTATWRDFPARLAELTGRDALLYDRLGHGGPVPSTARASAIICCTRRAKCCRRCWTPAA